MEKIRIIKICMMNKKIAIIIVTYNGSEYFGDLFSSLEKISYPIENFKIIIIDNASTDDSIVRIRNQESRIKNLKFFVNTKNVGFARGNNIGIEYAMKNNFDYVYLLNQDTVVGSDFLMHAIETMESDPKIGIAQSKLLLWKNELNINSWGNVIHYLGFGYSGGYEEKDRKLVEKEIAYASGAACIIRISCAKEVGIFQDEFFMYHEDLDLGWRMWISGYKVVLSPESIVYHKYEFSKSIKKYYYMERNRFLVLFQNYSIKTLLLIAPALCAMDILMLCYSFIRGFWREEIRVYWYFCNIKNWKKILHARKNIQSLRKRKDSDIIKNFTGVIAFQDVQNPLVKYIFNPLFEFYFFIIKKII